jgi:hypothetical protein
LRLLAQREAPVEAPELAALMDDLFAERRMRRDEEICAVLSAPWPGPCSPLRNS